MRFFDGEYIFLIFTGVLHTTGWKGLKCHRGTGEVLARKIWGGPPRTGCLGQFGITMPLSSRHDSWFPTVNTIGRNI